MRILVVAATEMEVARLTVKLGDALESGRPRVRTYAHRAHAIDVLTTGVGMVATAAWCSHEMACQPYDLGLNLGVCGSFDRALTPVSVVHVVSDRIAELGAEDDEAFLTAQDLKLHGANEFPFMDGRLLNAGPPASATLSRLAAVDGVTVNTIHGNERSIARLKALFNPQVESMEGAAFMYACLIRGLAFAQVRAVSNMVEKRNRGGWQIAEAVRSLGEAALGILDDV